MSIESKNVAGVSAGAVIVLVAASAFAVQRRRRLVKQSQVIRNSNSESITQFIGVMFVDSLQFCIRGSFS